MLLGRDDERRRLAALLADARIGTSGSLVIRGEPGVGKTALLDAAATEAGGMRILRASGVEAESGAPFAGLHELLGPVAALAERLPGPQAAAIGGALGLRPRVAADRVVLGAATLGLLASAAEETPVLVLVDDGQWLDAETAEALAFAARRLVADPIAVVVATRDGEPSPLLRAGLPEVVLGRLGQADAAALLAAVAGTGGDTGARRPGARRCLGQPAGRTGAGPRGRSPARRATGRAGAGVDQRRAGLRPQAHAASARLPQRPSPGRHHGTGRCGDAGRGGR